MYYSWIDVLDLCFDFESGACAVLRLKFRGPEANFSRAQSKHTQLWPRKAKLRPRNSKQIEHIENIGRAQHIFFRYFKFFKRF